MKKGNMQICRILYKETVSIFFQAHNNCILNILNKIILTTIVKDFDSSRTLLKFCLCFVLWMLRFTYLSQCWHQIVFLFQLSRTEKFNCRICSSSLNEVMAPLPLRFVTFVRLLAILSLFTFIQVDYLKVFHLLCLPHSKCCLFLIVLIFFI